MTTRILLTALMIFVSAGCGHVTEVAKTIYGSSTRKLNQLRSDGIRQAYRCSYDECFDAVLALTTTKVERSPVTRYAYPKDGQGSPFGGGDSSPGTPENAESAPKPAAGAQVETDVAETDEAELEISKKKNLELFLQNRRKGEMIVVGVPSAVDTTEVGVFFVREQDGITRIEFSSLSSNAKRVVSELVFAALSPQYPEVTP